MACVVIVYLHVQISNAVVRQKLFVELAGEVASNLDALALCASTVGAPRHPAPYLPELAGSHLEDHQFAWIASNRGDR